MRYLSAPVWSERVSSGPRLVSLVLAGMVLAEVARASLALLVAHAPSQVSLDTHRAMPVTTNFAVDVRAIVSAHLFGVAQEAAPDRSTAVVSTSDYLLAATFVTHDPRRGLAIIGANGLFKVYRIGAQLGGASLDSVYADHVIIERGGHWEKLLLRRNAQVGQDTLQSSAASLVTPSEHHGLARLMRVGGSVNDADGKLRGFRIFPGGQREAFNNTGLRGGDLVIAINGIVVADKPKLSGRDAFAAVESSARATLTIERFGKVQDINVDAAQE